MTPSPQQVDTWENAPAGSQAQLKCPRCHKWEVSWRAESRRESKAERQQRLDPPVQVDRGVELFQKIYQALNEQQN